jgi:hypothetical protein
VLQDRCPPDNGRLMAEWLALRQNGWKAME